MIIFYKNNDRRLGHMLRTLPPDSLARLATPRGGPRSLCFRCKGFPPSITAPTQLVRLEASVGPTCFCRIGSSESQQRKPERIGILIQAERAIKVGLRMFNADGRRLEDSHMLWPLLARPLDALAGLEWFCEAGSNVGACVENG